MSLLTHDELVVLVQRDVITNVRLDQINGASIDVTLGNVLWIEDNPHGQYNVVDLAQKETPHMTMVSMLSTGYYDLQPGGFCRAGAYDEIKDRRGHLRDGVFIKAEETRDEAGLPLGVAA